MINSQTLSFIVYNTEARFRNCMAAFMSMGKGMVVINKYVLYLADSLSGNFFFFFFFFFFKIFFFFFFKYFFFLFCF